MKFFITFAFILCLSYSSCSDLSKEGLLERIGKLEVVIQETLKKVAGDATGLVDDALLQVIKVQASLLKTLAQTVSGLPILSDLLLPTLQKTLEGIEMTVEQTVKKIETMLLGSGTTAKFVYYELSKEGLLDRIGKLEAVIQETLRKVAGHVTGAIDEGEIELLKAQSIILSQLKETLKDLPIISDVLLPTLENKLIQIELSVASIIKKIENMILATTPASGSYYDLSKEGLLERIGKLEVVIQETLKKVAGDATGLVDDALLQVMKVQASLLKTLAQTVSGLPILSDLLLPTLEKTLEGIEMTVEQTVKKIETLLLGSGTTAKVVYYELSKEGLLDRIGKLEATIQETLKKVAGDATGLVDDALLQVMKVQASLLKTLAQTVSGVPILSDLLLPTLEKTLEGIELTVEQTVKKIETMLLGATTTLSPPFTIKLTTSRGTTVRATLIPSTTRIAASSTALL